MWGSYEAYNALMGGLMVLLDMKHWRENIDELRESSDGEMGLWRDLVPAWAEAYGQEEVTASSLFEFAASRELLPDTLMDDSRSERSRVSEFGVGLRKLRDRVIGGYRVAQRTIRGVARYKVHAIAGAADVGPAGRGGRLPAVPPPGHGRSG